MSTKLLYLSQIRVAARDLKFEQVEETNGQFNDVVVVNQEWIFRFPRFREGVAQLAAETKMLLALQGLLPLPIPAPVYQIFDPPVPGLALMGYRRLPGEPLFRSVVEGITDGAVRSRLAGQLADFLRMLHAVPLHVLPVDRRGSAPRMMDSREDWEAMYNEVREKLYPAMRIEACKSVTEHFEAYLDDRSLHKFMPAVRHGDFGGSNILWDAQQGAVSGILDFSSTAPGDPAVDLASVSTLGDHFFSMIAVHYEPDGARRQALLARARFYRGTFALEEALHGLKNNDRSAYESGMADFL